MKANRTYEALWGIPVIIALLLIWELASRAGVADSVLLPAPSNILVRLFGLLQEHQIYLDCLVTGYRFLAGYIIGCAIAIPLGILLGISNRFYLSFDMLLECLRPIPASALIPIALLLFGLGDKMTIAIVAYAVVWPVLINTMDGVRSVDPVLIDTGKVFGLNSRELVRQVLIPASLPSIVTGMRISLALSITLVIVVEMLVGDRGLGHRIIEAERTFRFPEMYGMTFLIGALGYIANRTFIAVSGLFIGWHQSSHEGKELF